MEKPLIKIYIVNICEEERQATYSHYGLYSLSGRIELLFKVWKS